MTKLCLGCNRSFTGRSHAKTCSARCRKRLQRLNSGIGITVNKVEKNLKAHAKLLGIAALSPFTNQAGFISEAAPQVAPSELISPSAGYPPTSNTTQSVFSSVDISSIQPKPSRKYHFKLSHIPALLIILFVTWGIVGAFSRHKYEPSASFASRFVRALTLQPVSPLEGEGGLAGKPGPDGPHGKAGQDADPKVLDGARGTDGRQGVDGTSGTDGADGAQGIPGSNDCIDGVCVSRQDTSPGTQEAGNLNLSGSGIFGGDVTATNLNGNFSGDGSSITNINANNIDSGTIDDARLSANVTLQGNSFNGANELVQLDGAGVLPALDGSNLTGVDADTLDGNDSTFFTNADNIASGTLADARLSTNVTLQGNSFNGASQLVQLTGGGLLPDVDGSNLTNVDALTLQGNSSSYFTNATNISSGTLDDARLSGNVSLLGSSIQDGEVDDDLTISSSGSVAWSALTSYPAACAAGQAVTTIGDNLTCSVFAADSGSSNYIQNQSAADQAASFRIDGTGRAGTALQAPLFDTATATADR